jgi:hypothetical protein
VSKAHLLELSKEGFWRCAALQRVTLAAMRTRHALAERVNGTPIFKGKAAIVPRPEPPRAIKPEEHLAVMVCLAAKVMVLKMRHMAERDHDVAVAELEHEPALAELTEGSRLEVWGMSELGCKITVAEVPEVP